MEVALQKNSFSFKREHLIDVLEEAAPLTALHWKEIAHYQDIPLEMDREKYLKLEALDVLRCFIARNDQGALIGYAVFFVQHNIHYKSSLQAVQDVLFIHPEYRGTGKRFIEWCDQELKKEKVQVIYHHVKSAHNFGPMLERMGYQLVDLIYARRF